MLLKIGLEIDEPSLEDLLDSNVTSEELRSEDPASSFKNPHPYSCSRKIKNINSCVQDRCLTPYLAVVYVLNTKFVAQQTIEPVRLAPFFRQIIRLKCHFPSVITIKIVKKSQPIHVTFNKMKRYFIDEGTGHLYNDHCSSYNGAKGENCTKVVTRQGYGKEFQYKLAVLASYLSPFF